MAKSSKGICVLGSGRSGTSVVTGALDIMGVELGSNLLSPNHTNPKGFWEDKQIIEFHNALLKKLGPFNHPENWWLSKDLESNVESIKKYLESQYSPKKVWAFKDPRTCYFLPFWKLLFNELKVEAHYLIMIRNPLDVADSFIKAYSRSQNDALSIWKKRLLLALKETEGEKRIILDYDHFLDNSLRSLITITDTFKLGLPNNETTLKNHLNSFIDLKMRHHKTSIEDLTRNGNVGDDIKNLYSICHKANLSANLVNSKEFIQEVNRLYTQTFNRS